jgi:uncharacterized protein (TIGR00299 family) protein
MAVPVPAVLKLWEMRGCPIYSNGILRELVTPTGAAIVTTLVADFGPPPAMILRKVGLGAGSIDLPISNILRLWLGESHFMTEASSARTSGASRKVESDQSLEHSHSHQSTEQSTSPKKTEAFAGGSPSIETIAVLETQVDDLNPQAIGYTFEALFNAGAVDVFTQAVGMKKSRPGVLLTVVCHPKDILNCEAVLFRETSTLGIRRSNQQRAILHREIQQVDTEYGTIRIKIAWTGSEREKEIANVQPEYEDCAILARQHNLAWREVHRLALDSWYCRSCKVL